MMGSNLKLCTLLALGVARVAAQSGCDSTVQVSTANLMLSTMKALNKRLVSTEAALLANNKKTTAQQTSLNKIDASCKAGLKALQANVSILEKINYCKTAVEMPWVKVGPLSNLNTHTTKYPHTHYEWGVTYNSGSVHKVTTNSWNRGVRLSVVPHYPQGDTASNMDFGTTLFVKGLYDSGSTWVQHYYKESTKGVMYRWAGNGNANSINFYVSARKNPWQQVGTLKDLSTISGKYPGTTHEYAVKYNSANGAIHTVTLSSWNKGARVSIFPFYPQGDYMTKLWWGTALFVTGTADSPSAWKQYYFKQDGNAHYTQYSSNGNANGITVWVSKRPNPWVYAGTLNDLETVISKKNHMEYEYGVKYNSAYGDIHKVVMSSWNKGVRVTVYPMYPQGDNGAHLDYGTTLWVKGTHDSTSKWKQYYYKQNSLGKYAQYASNGNSIPQLFVMKRTKPWKPVGSLTGLDALIKKYPTAKYNYAVKYNSGHSNIHTVVMNGWNRGTRVTVYPDYPQGDTGSSMEFGTTVFVKGTHDTTSAWKQFYYKQDSNGHRVQYHTNGNSNSIQVFVMERPSAC